MRKPIAIVATAALLTVLPASPAWADGATVDKDTNTCSGLVPDENGNLIYNSDADIVYGTLLVRKNKSWTTMTCHFTLDEAHTPPQTTKASGFVCYTPEPTYDTRANASSGGRMVVTCRIRTVLTLQRGSDR
jgi:hypothetical protein